MDRQVIQGVYAGQSLTTSTSLTTTKECECCGTRVQCDPYEADADKILNFLLFAIPAGTYDAVIDKVIEEEGLYR